MSSRTEVPTGEENRGGWFETTHWSMVLSAAGTTATASPKALSLLCKTYWRPLYTYIRSRGFSVEESKDLTQDFFARLLEKDYLKDVDRTRGKFRSFLLASVKHFLSNEWDKARAQKRGGGQVPLSLDFAAVEGWRDLEPAHDLTPEKVFEKQWALTVLDRVMRRLREDYTSSKKGPLFDRLKPMLIGAKSDKRYQEIALELDLSEGAVKVAVHRLRRKYREILRDEIAQTVTTVEEIEEEIQYLLSALGS